MISRVISARRATSLDNSHNLHYGLVTWYSSLPYVWYPPGLNNTAARMPIYKRIPNPSSTGHVACTWESKNRRQTHILRLNQSSNRYLTPDSGVAGFTPAHNGRCNVLMIDGSLSSFGTSDLAKISETAVSATTAFGAIPYYRTFLK